LSFYLLSVLPITSEKIIQKKAAALKNAAAFSLNNLYRAINIYVIYLFRRNGNFTPP